jgi:hypothetical protein
MGSMETFVRPLSETERRLLTAGLRKRQRRLKSYWKRLLILGLVIFVGFSIAPMIASHGPEPMPILIWFGFVSLICLWVYFRERPREGARIRVYEDALHRSEAYVTRIQSREMVELEEVEDGGSSYAFQLSDNKIVFISGQYYYRSARFPNTDFSLVEFYGDNGSLVEGFIEKNGVKLSPQRTIPAKITSKMRFPNHLQVIDGRLDQLEQLFKSD